MLIAEATAIVREITGLESTQSLPALLSRFLEASKTTPSGFYRPYISIARYWRINPPRGGIIEGEQVKWKDTLEDQIKALESTQLTDDQGLPNGEIIPEGWAIATLAELPVFSAIIV